jgi:hypothetical protein
MPEDIPLFIVRISYYRAATNVYELTAFIYMNRFNTVVEVDICRKHFPILSSFMTYRRVCNLE